MQIPTAVSCLWLFHLLLLFIWPTDVKAVNSEDQLESLLATENFIIDELHDYIDRFEQELDIIKREVDLIEQIHGQAGNQVEEHMGNPLNVLTILKRFESVWPNLEQQATNLNNLTWSDKYYIDELELPTETDYDNALGNLLHLQSVYDLQPSALSLGMVNGKKFGSVMSWSDCLEMAIKSEQKDNANYAVAKYWLETALNKMTSINNTTDPTKEQERGKVRIFEAALNLEYRAGEYSHALAMAEELLLLRPTNQNVQKAKTKIELAISKLPQGNQRNVKAKQRAKSPQQQLIEELCREAIQQSVSGATTNHCQLDRSKPIYLLQPLHLEILSTDPYIVLYHDVLTSRQTDQLIELIDEDLSSSDISDFESLHFSKMAQKKLSRLSLQLDQDSENNMHWEARRHSHHNVMGTVGALGSSSSSSSSSSSCSTYVARVMLNLQPSKMGGAIVFPQLQLGINVPHGSLLYWRTCNENEFSMVPESDYRSRHAVCPVVLGEQMSAWTKLM